jgi:hypothetical protein
MVKFSFFAAHVSSGDDPKQGAPDRENDGQNSLLISSAKSRITNLGSGPGVIVQNDQRFIEKQLFAFSEMVYWAHIHVKPEFDRQSPLLRKGINGEGGGS